MLAKFDTYVSDVFEKFSYFWLKLTGKNCFWLAKTAVFFSALSIWLIPIILGNPYEDQLKSQYFATSNNIIFAVGFIFLFYLFFVIKKIEKYVKKLSQSGLANPLKISAYKSRLFLGVFSLFIGYLWSISAGRSDDSFLLFACIFFYYFFLLCGLYFISCNLLPPRVSKIREWAEGINFLVNQKKAS